jgi:putative Holliday junction resolvase
VRVVGFDLGARRIGVAVSDGTGTLASPRATIERSGDPHADRAVLASMVHELGAQRVVVGLPLSLDGRRGPAARQAQVEADELASVLAPEGIEVETFDERLTTVSAARALRDAGRDARAQRSRIDQSAAAVLLQAWLDGRARPGGDDA